MDKLVYGTERGYIVMRMLPSLQRYRRLQVSNEHPVLTIIISPDRRFLNVGCGDGGLIVITERGISNQTGTQGGSKSQGSGSGSAGQSQGRERTNSGYTKGEGSRGGILSSLQNLVSR